MDFLACVRQVCERRTRVGGLLVIVCLLTALQWSLAQQTTTFPGEQDPVGGPNSATGGSPDRLILFPDDELAIMTFSSAGPGNGNGDVPLWLQELSPHPDYTVPATPQNTSTAPNPWPKAPPGGENIENIFSNASVTRGRFVDPNRDALVVLTKVSTGAGRYIGCATSATNCLNWAVQEIPFTTPPPTPHPQRLPLFTFSAPVVADTVNYKSFDSPGAIAAGDLDKAIDKDGNYHDEIAMVTEYYDGSSGFAQVALSVIDYAVRPGQPTVNATVIGLDGGPMAYPLNISTLRTFHGHHGQAGRPRYPGMLAVTTGDFDGDGTTDIAVVALTYDAVNIENNLQVYFYKYNPGYTQNPPQPGSLTLLNFISIGGGPDDPTKPGAFFHGPLSVTSGDVDNDGKDEVIVAYLDNARTSEPTSPTGELTFHADLHLATVAFNSPTKAITTTTVVAVEAVEAWYDALNDHPPFNDNPPTHYQDIRVAAGLFKFNPEIGYPLTRRQIALAYVGGAHVEVALWEVRNPGEGGNTGQTAVLAPYSTTNGKVDSLPLPFCAGRGEANAISLVAGNFAGVKAKQPDTLPVWGLAVAYEVTATQVGVTVLRVDQGVDWKNGLFPITLVSQPTPITVANWDSACSRNSRNVLAAFDFDGDSLRLGAPVHFVLNDVQQFDYVLQEPPKHVDYLPEAATCELTNPPHSCNGIVNISDVSDFNITYGTSATNTVSHTTTKSTSWGAGVSTTLTAQATLGENAGIEDAEFSVDFKAQASYDYDQHQDDYKGQDSSYTVSQESVTSADDALAFQTRTTDIWRYRIYGAPSQGTDQNGQPLNSFYEIALPRALCTSPRSNDPGDCTGQSVIGGGKAHLELYQPWHENGNILSYPAADNEFQPPDIGVWTRPRCDKCNDKCTETIKTHCCAVNADDSTKEDCTTPLAPPQEFSWDGTASNEKIVLDASLTKASMTQWTSKFSADLNIGVGWKISEDAVVEDKVSGCVDVDLHGYGSWGKLSTASTTTTQTTDIALNKPARDTPASYNFFPTLYADTRGAYRAVHSVTIPTDVAFWSTHYGQVDPALNLPKKFSDADGGFKQFNVESDAKEMRGFLLRNGNTGSTAYGTLLSCGPVQLHDPALNNQVLLEARIYNYSVVQSISDVRVRFDVVELDDQGNECSDATACLTRTSLWPAVTVICTNPYNVSATECSEPNSSTLLHRGMGLAQYTLDISQLPLPTAGLSNPFRFYVVVDPDNGIQNETHEWHQATVVLTPDNAIPPGEQVCVEVQGTSTEKICFSVQTSADDVLQGLADAISGSATAQTYGLKATVIQFDATKPAESFRVIAGNPHVEVTLKEPKDMQLKPGEEFRAGFLDAQKRPFYFVPTTTNLMATNDVPGQNNEGYGARTLTVRVPTAAELLGGSDPCAGANGVDLSLAADALAAIDRDGGVHTGRVQVHPGQPLRLQLTASADADTATCEQAQLFLGDPTTGGQHLASRFISGVSADSGGRTWHPWRAPDTPGLYTLYARLQERPTDTQVGNNLATLAV